jgi:hypothetical protein
MELVRNFWKRLQLEDIPPRCYCLAAAASVLATLAAGAVFILWKDVNVWAGFEPSSELMKPLYWETTHIESVFRTRANTWSNLAYVYLGFLIIAIGFGDWTRKRDPEDGFIAAVPPFSIFFGAACCLLGIGSGIFHASMTRWGQQLDVVSMYLPLLALIAALASRFLPRIGRVPTWPFTIFLALLVYLVLYRYKWEMSATRTLGSLILILVLLAAPVRIFTRSRFSLSWLVSALALFWIAYGCRALDIAGRFSGPDDWWQGHSVWHLLTALSLGCAYLCFRSEIRVPAEKGQ